MRLEYVNVKGVSSAAGRIRPKHSIITLVIVFRFAVTKNDFLPDTLLPVDFTELGRVIYHAWRKYGMRA